jgi:hypothetical protein
MKTATTVALGSAAGSAASVVMAAVEGLRYSPWGDPGALDLMVRLVAAALLLAVFPAALLVVTAARQFGRAARASGLTPLQMALGEAVVMTAVDYAWHEHNVREAARLTDSVMGPERTGLWPES